MGNGMVSVGGCCKNKYPKGTKNLEANFCNWLIVGRFSIDSQSPNLGKTSTAFSSLYPALWIAHLRMAGLTLSSVAAIFSFFVCAKLRFFFKFTKKMAGFQPKRKKNEGNLEEIMQNSTWIREKSLDGECG